MYYITHVVMESFPAEDMRKLLFYTQQEDLNEFFWGTDNNAFPKESIDVLVAANKIVDILQRIPLEKNQWPWVDKDGVLYIADSKDPMGNRKKIGVYDAVLKKFYSDSKEESI